MGFRKGAYATVWSVEEKNDRWTKIKISVSKKIQDTDEYEQEFGGFVDCLGTACAGKAAKLKERDRICLGDVDVSTKYDKEKKVMYTNFRMFSFKMADEVEKTQGGGKPAPKKPQVDSGEPEAEEDPDLPF